MSEKTLIDAIADKFMQGAVMATAGVEDRLPIVAEALFRASVAVLIAVFGLDATRQTLTDAAGKIETTEAEKLN